VNLENVYSLDMDLKEKVLSMQDVFDADVKEVAKEMVEVIEIAKIIVDEVSTAGGELNAANEKPVSTAPINITTTQQIPNDEDYVFVNVTPLSFKPPTIVDYKIYKEGKKEYVQIFRANGNHQMYLAFSTMLKNFDREYLEVLWNIIKDRFKNSQPKELLDVFIWHTLKKTLSVSAISAKSYCSQFKLMLLEERLLLLENLMLLIQEMSKEIKVTAVRFCIENIMLLRPQHAGEHVFLTDYEEFDGGYVAFGGNSKGGKITRKGTKDETIGTLKSFITRVENLINLWVKVIRCDNGTEFKNTKMNQFCEVKGIMRHYSVARTPQQNRVAKRRNRTLIEAARTMLANSKLPTTFWAKAVNTACYVQNKVLVTKPHNKTPYKLFHGRTHAISFLRQFRYLVTILNTIDHLGKFDRKAYEGFFVGYLLNSKAFRVFNSRTRIVEENLHVRFSKNTPNNIGSGPNWLFDIDALTKTMNYQPVVSQSNDFSGTKVSNGAGKEKEYARDYILLPLLTTDLPFSSNLKSSQDNEFQASNYGAKKVDEDLRKENECND
nr:ribonuclease H-like domain-containing protein [Tanacetum cinerariifolium]